MTRPSLSVVIPVFNEAPYLLRTIDALLAGLADESFDTELVLVDDGSTDGSAESARAAVDGALPLRVIAQPNRGRFEARRAGLEAAEGEFALLLDGRVEIHAGALAYIRDRLEQGKRIWTGHVELDSGSDPLATFWKLIAELAWSDYFDDPRETSFGAEDFDRFPKGTTCFFAPRRLLLDAVDAFSSRYADLRSANDDTPLLRWLAERDPINVSPGFSCLYRPRTTLSAFLRHSVHRGVVFVDGHGRPESRFFAAVLAFYPISAALVVAALRKPSVIPAAVIASSTAAAGLGLLRRRSAAEVASLALVTPVYALAHGLGMWRGLGYILRQWLVS
jgi:glycosyltransferase involved in cell wall biosynthesis